MSELSRTSLHGAHLALGARLAPFAGFEMPIQYCGVIEETLAVRHGWGVFDVSHMGQLQVAGPGATAALNRIVSADWAALPVGRVAYALLLNEGGGVIDDIMGYRRGEDSWLIVANASRAEVDERHLREYLPPAIGLANSYTDQAMLAVQGPQAEAGLAKVLKEAQLTMGELALPLTTMKWRDFTETGNSGNAITIARGGYTGCDGFEIICSAATGLLLWNALMTAACTPCGLAARDALRLEAALPLYGHELREDLSPYESGCGFAVNIGKGDFLGRAALEDAPKPARRVRALRMAGRAVPRESYEVAQGGSRIGEVTSGSYSPTLQTGIALALLPAGIAIDETVDVMVRGIAHAATVVKPPFVPNSRKM